MDFRPGGDYLPFDWVDEGKLLLFVKTPVAERAPRKGKHVAAEKKRKLEAEAEDSKKEKKQRRQEAGTMAHNVAVKALKTSTAQGQHQRRRAEFEDRGLSTIMDRYTAKQIPNMTRVVWRNALGLRTSEQSFRTNLDFLFGNTMLLRQSNRLPLELPDLFSLDLPKEGQQGKGWCLVAAMDQGKYHLSLALLVLYIFEFSMLTTSISIGKTNQHGRLEYGAALRHRDHQSCLISALAAYLFWRWHCSDEAFPCFRTSQDWYNIKLLKRDNSHLQEQLSCSTASEWTRRLYNAAGLKVSRVGHAPRQSGAQLAELNGVSEPQGSLNLPLAFPFANLLRRSAVEGVGITTR
jgi:hypothetical protein